MKLSLRWYYCESNERIGKKFFLSLFPISFPLIKRRRKNLKGKKLRAVEKLKESEWEKMKVSQVNRDTEETKERKWKRKNKSKRKNERKNKREAGMKLRREEDIKEEKLSKSDGEKKWKREGNKLFCYSWFFFPLSLSLLSFFSLFLSICLSLSFSLSPDSTWG